MRKLAGKLFSLVMSGTAKDTYVLFGGNVLSSFLGFLYVLLVARSLTLSDFGIFSAATNLVVIIVSLTDLGIASGAINFISEKLAKGYHHSARFFIQASFLLRILVGFIFSLIVVLFAKTASPRLLATPDWKVAIWVAVISLAMTPSMLFPSILQAQKRFFASVVSDNAFYLSRLAFAFFLFLGARLNVSSSLSSFFFAAILGGTAGLALIGPRFLTVRPPKEIYKKLITFSSWLGVNRIISSISGRLDVTLLAILAGSITTGLYSVPSRLSGFIVVLASSFSAVLAPRLAGFGDKKKEWAYILKATLVLIPLSSGVIIWAALAEPFIRILFGDKFVPAVGIFQALALAMIPFLFTVPSVTAIIYALKRPIFIGIFSFVQLALIFLLNLLFIPRFGAYGPAVTFGIVNSVLAIYSWLVVLRYYRNPGCP